MIKTKHQDYIYLNENFIDSPKETFKFALEIINEYHSKANISNILDLGCAQGEWIHFIKTKVSDVSFTGVDYSEKLIGAANINFSNVNNVNFVLGSAQDIKLEQKFDVIHMAGVISYFDDTIQSLSTIKKHLSNKGICIILDNFNQYDIDVLVNYRNNKYSKTFEKGWNLHSIQTINRNLKKLELKVSEQRIFRLPFKLNKQSDPARSWTINTEMGTKFVNGLSQIFDIHALIVTHK